MDANLIVCIIVAFVIGCTLAWLIAKRKLNSHDSSEEIEVLKKANADLESCRVSLEKEKKVLATLCQDQEKAANQKIAEAEANVKAQYDELIERIKEENARLENALKQAAEGNVDEAIYEPMRRSLEESKSECTKLIKKIKKLEDEVEEAEDEQEALEKKLKSKGAELQEVNDQLENSLREIKSLRADLEQKEAELANRIDELKRKSGSIEFVQEILSAPETGAEDVKKLYRAIDFFESFLRGQFMDCNAYLYNTYSGLSFNDASGRAGFVEKKKIFLQLFEQWASVKRKSWLDKKTTIAFVGEFSAGKTSIVNRILSQDDLNIPRLPVSTKATTAIPTYIAGGVAETYNFVTPNDQLKAINEEVFKKVSKEVLDEIKGVSSLIKYFVMTYKNPNLNGLSILDTPGFNSNDAEDKERTIDVINECDALFWVFDVNAGTVNRSSIALIKEKLNKPLIVVINKVDTKSTSEVDKVENLIRKTLSDEGLNVEKFIRFSAKAPLQDIMTPINEIHRDESRDEFISIVENDILQLMDIINSGVKDANEEYQKCTKKAERISDKFNRGMESLWNSCNEAAGIPHWKEHFFSSDRYEMNKTEGTRLIELLEEIATTRSNAIADIYNEEMLAVAEEQQAYSDLVDLEASWKKIDDCLKEFKKTTKQLR